MRIQMKILNKEFYKTNDNPTHYNLDEPQGYKLPSYATPGSAAMDLIATEDVTLMPGECKLIPTGLAIWIGSSKETSFDPTVTNERRVWPLTMGVAGLILPRSGLGTKGLVLANTIGVIDEDYQGELLVSALNRNNSKLTYIPYIYTNGVKDKDLTNKIGLKEGIHLSPNQTVVHVEEEQNSITIKAGQRFAQLCFMPVIKVQWDIAEEFSKTTERNTGGFGSTSK